MKSVYMYCPPHCPRYVARESYSPLIGRIAAKLLNAEFKGSYDVVGGLLKGSEFLIPHTHISTKEGEILGVSPNNIYGYAGPALFTYKTILQTPIDNYEYIPDDFPLLFANKLKECNLVTPGYSVFSIGDSIKAYRLLSEKGYTPRFKPSLGTGGRGQTVLHSEEELLEVINRMDDGDLRKYGVVLEANLLGTIGSEERVATLSGGVIRLGSNVFSYLGEQKSQRLLESYEYSGTDLVLGKMSPMQLASELGDPDPLYLKTLEMMEKLEIIVQELKGAVVTRLNFDFIVGRIDGGSDNQIEIFVADQGFGFGDATIAEFLAIDDLLENPGMSLSRMECHFSWDDQIKEDIPEDAIVCYEGKYPRSDFELYPEAKIYHHRHDPDIPMKFWVRKKTVVFKNYPTTVGGKSPFIRGLFI